MPKSPTSSPPPKAPRLPATFDGTLPPAARLASQQVYDYLALADLDFSGQTADQLRWESSTWARVALRETHLSRVRLTDVRVQACDLANARWPQAEAQRVEFLDCRLLGFQGPEARLRDIRFHRCAAKLASFPFTRCVAVRFEACDLTDATFQGADLTGTVFAGCDLTNVDFAGATLQGVDLRGSSLAGLKVEPAALRGVHISPEQAVELMRVFGVVVEEISPPAAGPPR